MSVKPLKAIVLAAGKGTRMRTDGCDLPKVMRLANGKPLLHYVLAATDFIAPEDTVLVVGYKKESVIEAFPGYGIAHQDQQLGTGHAVQCAFDTLQDFDGDVLICCGDMPLVKKETFTTLVETHRASGDACTMLTGTTDQYLPYGRILRDENGKFLHIVEEKDCTPEQKNIKELNVGVYVFDANSLRSALKQLKNNNNSGEYYLTDVPGHLREAGKAPGVCMLPLGNQIIGVNTPDQLAEVEAALNER